MTLSLGWWIVPALITLAAYIAARLYAHHIAPESDPHPDHIAGTIQVLLICGGWLLACVATLAAWLIWALVA